MVRIATAVPLTQSEAAPRLHGRCSSGWLALGNDPTSGVWLVRGPLCNVTALLRNAVERLGHVSGQW